MPTEEEVNELIKCQKERAEINRLIRIKAISGARLAASSILYPVSSTSSTNHHHSHDLNEEHPLDRFKGPTEYAEHETKIGVDHNTIYQMAIIKEINEHHARLRELSAYLAASLVLDKSEEEVFRIVRQGTDPRIAFLSSSEGWNGIRAGDGSGDIGGDDEVPKELYVPRAFEALRRDLVLGGRVSKSIGEEDEAMLLSVITDAMKGHGVRVKELVGGVWVHFEGFESGGRVGGFARGMDLGEIRGDIRAGMVLGQVTQGQNSGISALRRARNCIARAPCKPESREPGYENRRLDED